MIQTLIDLVTESLISKVWIVIYTWKFATYLGFFQYFTHASTTVVVWDHLITLSDEVKYVWKKEKSWREFPGSPSRIRF